MRNQGRRNSYSDIHYQQRDDNGRFVSNDDNRNWENRNRNSRLYQDRNDDYKKSEWRGQNSDYNHRDTSSDYGSSRGNNSGYYDNDSNSGFSGRRGENYGYGSQQNNDSYRNFSTQGRNSGLGNQGSYSSYDDYSTNNLNEHSNDQYSDRRNPRYFEENNQGEGAYGKNFRRDQMNNGSWGSDDSRGWGRSQRDSNQWENEGNLGSRDDEWSSRQSYGSNSYSPSRRQHTSDLGGISGMNTSRFNRDNDSSSSLGSYSYGSYGDRTQTQRGKGPKGYKRSDERITEDVNDTLMHDQHIDASEIEVNVKNGEVTLSGSVSNKHDKRHAEDIIENLSGVTGVENKIRVTKDSDSKKDSDKDQKESKSAESSTEKSRMKTQNGVHA